MGRRIIVTLEGPRVAEWVRDKTRDAVAGPHFRRNPCIASGLYVVDVDVAWTGDPIGHVAIRVIDHLSDTDDPDALVTRALTRINDHVDGLARKADQLEARVENA